MRSLMLLAAMIVPVSCASPTETRSEPAAPAPGGVVIQVHSVADLLAAGGTEGGIDGLASRARREVESVPGGSGPDVSVAPHKNCLLVIAPPEAQARVTALLTRARADVNPGAR
jgi:hypothetical protein